jgi:DNA-binding beta-propeller fold protein YncE
MPKTNRFILAGILIVSGLVNIPSAHAATGTFAILAADSGALQITLDSDQNVYVTNYKNNSVTKLNSSGTEIWTKFTGSGTGPRGIATDESGNIFVSLYLANKVAKISPDGSTVDTGFATTGSVPSGIALDSSGNIYTANFNSNNVTKFSSNGGAAIATYATGNGPRNITIDSFGNVYTCNYNAHTVTKITSAGVTSTYATGLNPWGITVDSLGNVYTANYGSNSISKIFSNGDTVTSFASTAPAGTRPVDLVLDPDGNLYTANTLNSTVTRITQSSLSATTGGTATLLGNVSSGVNGMAIDSAGNIYTSSYQNISPNSIYRIDNSSSPAFSLSSSTESVNLGSPITGYNVISGALAISSFSISPAISNGLSFNNSTGRITGTPLAVAPTVTYTITGNNRTTWESQTYAITVNAAPVAKVAPVIKVPTLKQPPLVLTANKQVLSWAELAKLTLTGGVDSGTVTFQNSGDSYCLIDVPTMNALTTKYGTCIITAYNSGDSDYMATQSNSIKILVAENTAPELDMNRLSSIYFASGTYYLNSASKTALNRLAASINAKSPTEILCYGFTDSKGGTDNTYLSKMRAKSVSDYLKAKGVTTEITLGWYADAKPADTGSSKAALAKNRRVEIYIK